jgi:uracil-DNA glycosylase
MASRRLTKWDRLNQEIVACRQCPRLIEHCLQVAGTRRKAYVDEEYWGGPVPNFGDRNAQLLIVGLAPGAHGANRTGRMFTGDRSGDWLFRALFRAGFANQAESIGRDDGLTLSDCAITGACHCAPPDNKPTREELETCHHWFDQTVELVPFRVYLALGQIAWRLVVDHCRAKGELEGRLPKFRHGAEVELANDRWLVGSFHPSQQNTFTGRLTESMFDQVFSRVRELIDS